MHINVTLSADQKMLVRLKKLSGSYPSFGHVSQGKALLERQAAETVLSIESVSEIGSGLDSVFLSSRLLPTVCCSMLFLWLNVTRKNLGMYPGWHQKGRWQLSFTIKAVFFPL